MPEWVAAPLAAACLGLGVYINRKVRGFLPDDLPHGIRKGHRRPTSLAGVLLAPVVLGWLLSAQLWLLAAGAAVALVIGFVDDRYKEREGDLDWRLKGVALLVAAGCVAAHAAVQAGGQAGGQDGLQVWEIAAIAVLSFVLINACNFLDNTDGVCASLAAVGLLLATGGNGALAAAGFAALAFLPFNWPRPAVFLGDCGALMLGVCLSAVAVQGWPEPQLVAAPVAVLLLDFCQVVLARVLLGYAPWIGDRRHITHMVVHLGWPKVLVAPLFAGLAAAGYWALTQVW